MAVDKMELLKRYKELKAQGVDITLMELKKQMESGNDVTDTSVTSNESNSSSNSVSPYQGDLVEQPKNEPYENAYHMVEEQGSSITTTPETSSHQSSWTTSYYSQPSSSLKSTSEPLTTKLPTPEAYSGNVSFEPLQNSNYADNFNANYSFGMPQPQAQTLQQQELVSSQLITDIPKEEPQPIVSSKQELYKYCLIGYPLGHSLSTYIHNAGFKSLGIDSTYEILETPPDSLVDRIKFLKSNNYAGFNVTIPLKLPVTLFLDEIDISADVVGAVNTVVINPDKTMKGYNTDVIGFRNAIPSDVTLAGKVAGVLGTGGAARAAITALAQSQVRKIKVYTRNIPNSAELMKFLREKFPMVEFEVFQIERIRDLSDVNILVNTTPIGMQGRAADFTPIEENELRTLPQGAVVYDVIYNPKKTVLLKLAQKNGYKTINGVDMFIHQAVAAEEIWTGKTPNFKDMKIAALENL